MTLVYNRLAADWIFRVYIFYATFISTERFENVPDLLVRCAYPSVGTPRPETKPRSAHEKIAQPVPFAGGAPEYAKK